MKGYPGQLMGTNDAYAGATAKRACEVFVAVDTGVMDPNVTAQYDAPNGNGDDGSYRNNVSYYSGGWDIFEANHHYSKLSGDDRNSGAAITALTCIGSEPPAQALTINGGSTATVTAGQKATLAWSDNDNFIGANQTCTATTDNTDPNGVFTIPVPDASNFPYPTCGGNEVDVMWGKSNSVDPGQTSKLINAPTNSSGDPLYQYTCDSITRIGPRSPAGCQDTTSECTGGYDDGHSCQGYTNTAWCPVSMPTGSVSVTAASTGTFHYHYNCKNAGGQENDQTVTLTVTAGDTLPDLTASSLATVPSQPIVNQAATISATFSNSDATSTGIGFTDVFQIDPPEDTDHSNPYNVSTSSPALAKGASNSRSIIYTFNEQGTWNLRACADSGNDIAESNETNNCTNGGAWTGITVKGVTVTLSCSVDTPLPVDAGTPVKLTAHPGGFTDPLTYSWTTSPGSSCGNTNPCNTTYSTAGDYTPSVMVSDTVGDVKTVTCVPDVKVRPICSVNPPSGTVPQLVTWSAFNGGSYEWYDSLGNDLGSGTTYQHTYTVPDTYGAYVVSNGQQSTTCYSNLQSCNQNPSGTLTANPTRVATGTASTLTYSTLTGVTGACQIVSTPASTPIPLGTADDSCTLPGSFKKSAAIDTQTLFKIVCGSQDVNGASTTVDVAPDINEF